MNCEQVRELEAAFALDALDDDERAAVAAHLEGGSEHGSVAEQRAVAMLLGSAASVEVPPAGLRERVLAASAGRDASSVRRGRAWWYGAAAAVVVVIAGALVAAMLLNDGNGSELHVREFETEAGVAVRFEADFDDTLARATFAGLESRETYHLWAIRGEDWLSMGTFRANPEGGWSGDFPFQMRPGDAVCLTIAGSDEPSGPFGEPVFMEPLL